MNYSMENHSQWKGGRRVSSDGYVTLHKPKGRSKPIAEHRYMMEKHLGRKLLKWELIHHKNGIKDDNRLVNLEIVLAKKHMGTIRCPHCLNKFKIK